MVTLVVLLLLPLIDVQSELFHSHALLLLGLLLVEVIRRQVGGERHVQDLILFRRMKDSLAGQRHFFISLHSDNSTALFKVIILSQIVD